MARSSEICDAVRLDFEWDLVASMKVCMAVQLVMDRRRKNRLARMVLISGDRSRCVDECEMSLRW